MLNGVRKNVPILKLLTPKRFYELYPLTTLNLQREFNRVDDIFCLHKVKGYVFLTSNSTVKQLDKIGP